VRRLSARYRKGTGYPPKRHLRGNNLSPGCASSSGFLVLVTLIALAIPTEAEIDHEQEHEYDYELEVDPFDRFIFLQP